MLMATHNAKHLIKKTSNQDKKKITLFSRIPTEQTLKSQV